MSKHVLPIGTLKRCTGCKEIFPNTTDYYWRKKKGDDLHLQSKCITCKRLAHANWRKLHTEKAHERAHRHYYKDIEKTRAQLRERAKRHADRKRAANSMRVT